MWPIQMPFIQTNNLKAQNANTSEHCLRLSVNSQFGNFIFDLDVRCPFLSARLSCSNFEIQLARQFTHNSQESQLKINRARENHLTRLLNV